MTNEQFGDEEENLAHMELDKYLMDLSTRMEVDSEEEGGGWSETNRQQNLGWGWYVFLRLPKISLHRSCVGRGGG